MELIEYCKMAIFVLASLTGASLRVSKKGLSSSIEQDEVESGTTWPC